MPKNGSRGGGRAPKNFDPSYARGASSSKPGSRSAGHRGYRPESADASSKKPRWTGDERIARGHREDRRGAGFEARTERPARDDRSARDDRPARGAGFSRDDHGPRRFDRDDRAPRRDFGDRNDRPARSFDRDDRAPRRDVGDRNDRPARSFDGNDRGPRRDFGDRNDRPARRFEDDRPRRSFERSDRSDRPERSDRPARSFDRDDRGPRRDFGDRAARPSSDRPARSDRPVRSDRPNGDRPSADRGGRRFDDDRPRRSFDRDDRAPRRDVANGADRPARTDRADRPARRFDDDRPRRSFDRDERAPRRDAGDRGPRRESGDRAARSFDRDARPERRESAYFGAAATKFTAHDDQVLERLQAEATQASDVEGVTFGDLGLGQGIVRALDAMGAAAPFPIQAATIPDVLAGKDVLGRGRTGSGKTIAFGAPTAERLVRAGSEEIAAGKRSKREFGRAPRALILAPTRELALQIDRTVQPIARAVGLFTTQVYGGVPQRSQVIALERGVDIVIGTPGRIEDLLEQGRLDLSQVMVTVLDEADHMCDLGFLEPVQRILRETAEGGQKLLFSATLDSGVAKLVDEFLVEPAVHEVAGEDQASGTIEHRVFVIDQRDKIDVIRELADRDGKTLIFSRTRSYAEELAERLDGAGIPSVSLHGDLNQSRRTRNLEKLTTGRVNVLVATDVAARGIHVDDIDLVIQADAPDEYKTYLHRSGRTGRAGKVGTVVTLASRGRTRKVQGLLERAEIDAQWSDVRPGDVLIADIANGASVAESAE